jgi:HrpA-like RNA helicase
LLSRYCCLVVDEAHERTISIDVILGRLKFILQKRKDFKVIITSASMDAKRFGEYFNVKPIKIPGRLYPV